MYVCQYSEQGACAYNTRVHSKFMELLTVRARRPTFSLVLCILGTIIRRATCGLCVSKRKKEGKERERHTHTEREDVYVYVKTTEITTAPCLCGCVHKYTGLQRTPKLIQPTPLPVHWPYHRRPWWTPSPHSDSWGWWLSLNDRKKLIERAYIYWTISIYMY